MQKQRGLAGCSILQELATKTHCIHFTLRPIAIGNTTAGATALAAASFSTGAVAGSWRCLKVHLYLLMYIQCIPISISVQSIHVRI